MNSLTLDNIKNALQITKVTKDELEKKVIQYNQSLIDTFVVIVEYYFHEKELTEINSTTLTMLWEFFEEGIRIRELFKKVDVDKVIQDIADSLEKIKYLEYLTFQDFLNIGTLLSRLYVDLFIIVQRLDIAKERYKNVFSKSDNPSDWLNFIDFEINDFFTKNSKYNPEKFTKLLTWIKVRDNPDLNPVYQR